MFEVTNSKSIYRNNKQKIKCIHTSYLNQYDLHGMTGSRYIKKAD